jgi:hypothetical protein
MVLPVVATRSAVSTPQTPISDNPRQASVRRALSPSNRELDQYNFSFN